MRTARRYQRHHLWLHADGAHGASLCVSRERHKLAGIERADSVAWDAHKTLLCPSLVTGVLFARHALLIGLDVGLRQQGD